MTFAAMNLTPFIVVASFLLSVTHANAQQVGEDMKGMPKEQMDHYSKFIDISTQYTQAIKIKNPLAKKDAMDKLTTDTRAAVSGFNEMLSKDGVKDWIGTASVLPNALIIRYQRRKDPSITIEFSTPLKDLPKAVHDVAKSLKRGDQVQFSVTADTKAPARMTGNENRFRVEVPTKLLSTLSIVPAK